MDHSPENPPKHEAGQSAELTESAELQSHFTALHERYATTADVPVGAVLAEFIDVVDLTAPPTPVQPTPTTRRTKMLTGIGAFVATTTGKIVLGTSVAAASVGGMHAAEIVDVPLLPEQANAEVLMVDEEPDAAVAAVADESAGDEVAAQADGEAPATTAPLELEEEVFESDEEEAVEDADSDAEDVDEDDKNHGSVVSEFARTTELEGCERGQAVAELARSKPKKHEADNEDSDDDISGDDDAGEDEDALADEEDDESKCKDTDDDDDEVGDDDDDEEEDDDDDEDESDDDGEGPPEGKGHNRDDHPGQGNSGGSDD